MARNPNIPIKEEIKQTTNVCKFSDDEKKGIFIFEEIVSKITPRITK